MNTEPLISPTAAEHRSAAAAPLYGLVLAGGRSARMQRDKAAVQYHGRSQLQWAMALLQPHVQRAFVSVRADQTADPLRSGFEQIIDERSDLGPTAGILAAQARHPQAAWLVLACDLPFLDAATLTELVRARRPDRLATAFRSSRDGLPEPLCAIFEPASREALQAYVARGRQCPRKFLLECDVQLLALPAPEALDNVNTPEEYGSAVSRLAPVTGGEDSNSNEDAKRAGSGPRRVAVQYYALLREQAGRSNENLVTTARTPRELYAELCRRYSFTLAAQMLRVAVNGEFASWSQPLREDDAVVFIPPVAGG